MMVRAQLAEDQEQTSSGEFGLDAFVSDKELIAEDIAKLSFRLRDGTAFPRWEPGAHLEITLEDQVRHYSLCSSPSVRDRVDIAVLRATESKGGSQYVHDRLVPGAQVTIRAVRNHFPLVRSARYLFLAGGIGITPTLAMIETAQREGSDWTLVYCGRRASKMAFADELKAKYPDRVIIHTSETMGRLDLANILGVPRARMLVYACGPQQMIDEAEEYCRGWPPGVLHYERFSAPPTTAGASTESFEVELAQSQLTLQVPVGSSILEAAEGAGIRVLSSCRLGVCGTCETPVLEGEVEHRDAVLSGADHELSESMMVCVSRAAAGCSRLVLDL